MGETVQSQTTTESAISWDYDPEDWVISPCAYYTMEYIDEKFVLVAVIGTLVAMVSLVENSLLAYLFITRPRFRTTHLYYMTYLAFFDILMAIAYLSVLSVDVWVNWLHPNSLQLYRVWLLYVKPMFTVTQITLVSSAFLIVASTLERYFRMVSSLQHAWQMMRDNRLSIAVTAILLGVVARGSIYWELEVRHNENCSGFSEYTLGLSALATSEGFYTSVWRFYVRNLCTIVVPFFVLAFCNGAIVARVRRDHQRFARAAKTSDSGIHRLRRRQAAMTLDCATRMLVLVITSFLIAKALNVFVTVWEYLDADSLMSGFSRFYALSVSIVSLLTVAASACRLWIYAYCNEGIRNELWLISRRALAPVCCWLPCWDGGERKLIEARHSWTDQWMRRWQHERDTSTLRRRSAALLLAAEQRPRASLAVPAAERRRAAKRKSVSFDQAFDMRAYSAEYGGFTPPMQSPEDEQPRADQVRVLSGVKIKKRAEASKKASWPVKKISVRKETGEFKELLYLQNCITPERLRKYYAFKRADYCSVYSKGDRININVDISIDIDTV